MAVLGPQRPLRSLTALCGLALSTCLTSSATTTLPPHITAATLASFLLLEPIKLVPSPRAFPLTIPSVWNSLSQPLRLPPSLYSAQIITLSKRPYLTANHTLDHSVLALFLS